jgi:ferredoxin-NADP reductase
MSSSDKIRLTVAGTRLLAPGFLRIEFEAAPLLIYTPGQFLTFIMEIDGQELRRSYSLITVPALDAAPAIAVRRIDNGIVSRFLFDRLRVGDVLETNGASGLFQLPPLVQHPELFFFFAAGSGITPIYALLRYALYQRPGCRCVLVYSNQSPQVAALLPGLEQLQVLFPGRFSLHVLFSNDRQLRRARLTRDRILLLLEEEKVDVSTTWFYTCGPESYMRLCTYVLREAGMAAGRIRREDFIPLNTALPPIEPPDTSPQELTIYWLGQRHHLQVAWPDTILKAAGKAGIELPYSCAAGRCGSCVARCTKGHVWLAQNEVLTDEDLARGLTLTCVGYPQGGAVIDLTPPGAKGSRQAAPGPSPVERGADSA